MDKNLATLGLSTSGGDAIAKSTLEACKGVGKLFGLGGNIIGNFSTLSLSIMLKIGVIEDTRQFSKLSFSLSYYSIVLTIKTSFSS